MRLRDKIWLDGFRGLNDEDVIKYKYIGRSYFEDGFDACEAQYLPMVEKLESALKYTMRDGNRPFLTLVNQQQINEALAELAEFKKKMNGEK